MKRSLVLVLLVLGVVLFLVVLPGCSQQQAAPPTAGTQPAPPATTPGGHKTLSVVQLTDVAPGLGTIMVEVAYRNWIMFYAATGGNWELAAYQAKEMDEIIEVGETTRPARKPFLQKFSKTALDPLVATIKAKDRAKFLQAWKKEVDGCNSCHASQSFKFIKWQLPKTPPEDLTLTSP